MLAEFPQIILAKLAGLDERQLFKQLRLCLDKFRFLRGRRHRMQQLDDHREVCRRGQLRERRRHGVALVTLLPGSDQLVGGCGAPLVEVIVVPILEQIAELIFEF